MRPRFVSLTLLFVVSTFCSPAFADSLANYSINGTYNSGSPSTALSAPGESFSMNFSLPINPVDLIAGNYAIGDDFYTYPVDIMYSYGGTTTTLANALVAFYSSTAMSSQLGGLAVDYCVSPSCFGNPEYVWNFAGLQQYTGTEDNPTLMPTSFPSPGQGFTFYPTGGDDAYLGSTDSQVQGMVVPTPEPSPLLLLGAGLAGLALMAKLRG